jgi:hypothetical protein
MAIPHSLGNVSRPWPVESRAARARDFEELGLADSPRRSYDWPRLFLLPVKRIPRANYLPVVRVSKAAAGELLV